MEGVEGAQPAAAISAKQRRSVRVKFARRVREDGAGVLTVNY